MAAAAFREEHFGLTAIPPEGKGCALSKAHSALVFKQQGCYNWHMCTETNCQGRRIAKGLCWVHYQRLRRTGTTSPRIRKIPLPARVRPDAESRFWASIERTEDCWLWARPLQPTGYGAFRIGGKSVFAHRFSYELMVGPIPHPLTIDHLCRVRACVNPDHLEAVTLKVNVLRGMNPAAINARKMTCQKGHPFSKRANGTRGCYLCQQEGRLRWRRENREAWLASHRLANVRWRAKKKLAI